MSVLKARRLPSTSKSPEFITFRLEFGCPSCRMKLGRDALALDANAAARPTLFVSQVAAAPAIEELEQLHAEIEALANSRQAELHEQASLAFRVAADVASQAVANGASAEQAALPFPWRRQQPPGPPGPEPAEQAALAEHAAEQAEQAAEQAEQAAEDAEPAAEDAEPAAEDAGEAADDDFQPDWGADPAVAAPAVPQAGALPAAAEAANASPVPQAGVMPAAAWAAKRADEDAKQGQGKGWERDNWREPDGNDWTKADAQKGWQEWTKADAQKQGQSGWDNWSEKQEARPSPVQESASTTDAEPPRREPPHRIIYSTSAVGAALVERYPEHRITLESSDFDASALRARGLNASSCMQRDIDHIAQVLWFLSNLHYEQVPRILLEPQLRELLESSEPADLRQKFARKDKERPIRNPSAWIQASVHDAADHADGGRSWPGEQDRPQKRKQWSEEWRKYG